MAAIVEEPAIVERPGWWDRASWGALFAGFFVGIGLLFLLLSFGAAIGITAVDPRDVSSWKNAGIAFGVWGGISAIIASFLSAWAAGRLSSARTRVGGAMHGVTLWGLTWAVMMWVGAMLVGGVVQGVASAAGNAASATVQSGQVSRTDLQQGEQAVQQQVQGAKQQLQENAGQLSETAESAGKRGAWGAFLAALLTLIASAAGGAAAVATRHAIREDLGHPHRPLEPSPVRP
jgi:hypothetical protein